MILCVYYNDIHISLCMSSMYRWTADLDKFLFIIIFIKLILFKLKEKS